MVNGLFIGHFPIIVALPAATTLRACFSTAEDSDAATSVALILYCQPAVHSLSPIRTIDICPCSILTHVRIWGRSCPWVFDVSSPLPLSGSGGGHIGGTLPPAGRVLTHQLPNLPTNNFIRQRFFVVDRLNYLEYDQECSPPNPPVALRANPGGPGFSFLRRPPFFLRGI